MHTSNLCNFSSVTSFRERLPWLSDTTSWLGSTNPITNTSWLWRHRSTICFGDVDVAPQAINLSVE